MAKMHRRSLKAICPMTRNTSCTKGRTIKSITVPCSLVTGLAEFCSLNLPAMASAEANAASRRSIFHMALFQDVVVQRIQTPTPTFPTGSAGLLDSLNKIELTLITMMSFSTIAFTQSRPWTKGLNVPKGKKTQVVATYTDLALTFSNSLGIT